MKYTLKHNLLCFSVTEEENFGRLTVFKKRGYDAISVEFSLNL